MDLQKLAWLLTKFAGIIPKTASTLTSYIAAFEAAISEGVDVISVVTTTGNEGPGPGTVENVAPWMVTVAASTIDHEFNSYVALGNRKHLKVQP